MKEQNLPYRYPGVTPFTSQQSKVFYGRTKETDLLFKMISLYPVSTLYSKSGLGKSSLINAGVIPKILEEGAYNPITIRFGAKNENSSLNPTVVTCQCIKGSENFNTILTKLIPDDISLWTCAKNNQISGKGKPLIIFDQFEELFTYSHEDINEFLRQATELLDSFIPIRYRKEIRKHGKLSSEDQQSLETELDVRLLFSIRSDKLHLMDRIKNYIPEILKRTFELKPLTTANAREAIVEPAKMEGDFITPPFNFTEEAVDKLVHVLKEEKEDAVEGYFIQLLCEHYERQLIKEAGITLGVADISDTDAVISNYYYQKISSLDRELQSDVRIMIEDGLVNNDLRLTRHESELIDNYNVDKSVLDALVDNRLLRSIPFSRGGYSYELSHDRLVPAVLESKTKRENEEAERLKQEENTRLKAEAERARIENEKSKKQLRTVRMLLAVALIAFAVASGSLLMLKLSQDTLNNERVNSRMKDYNFFIQKAENHAGSGDFEKAIESYGIARKFTDDTLRIDSLIDINNSSKESYESIKNTINEAENDFSNSKYPESLQKYKDVINAMNDYTSPLFRQKIIGNLEIMRKDLNDKKTDSEDTAESWRPTNPSRQQSFLNKAEAYRKLIEEIDNTLRLIENG